MHVQHPNSLLVGLILSLLVPAISVANPFDHDTLIAPFQVDRVKVESRLALAWWHEEPIRFDLEIADGQREDMNRIARDYLKRAVRRDMAIRHHLDAMADARAKEKWRDVGDHGKAAEILLQASQVEHKELKNDILDVLDDWQFDRFVDHWERDLNRPWLRVIDPEESRMKMLSDDDLNLKDMTPEELDAAWNLWFDLAQSTNDSDPPFTHGVFVNLTWEDLGYADGPPKAEP